MVIAPDHLFTEIGSAMWMIQTTENALVHYIAIVLKKPEDENTLERLISADGRKTLGGLIRELKRHTTLPDALETRIGSFLDERNWLAHRIYKESHSDLHSESKGPALFQRVEALGNEAIELARIFADATRAWRVGNGASPEELDRIEEETLKRWRTQT